MDTDKAVQLAITALTQPQEFSQRQQQRARGVLIGTLLEHTNGVGLIELAERAMHIDDRRAVAEILGHSICPRHRDV